MRELHTDESSNILVVRYDGNTQKLEVEFANHGRYEYADVPSNLFGKLAMAESIGSFFNARIKKQFEATKLPDREKDSD